MDQIEPLQSYLEEKNLSQEQFARMVGVTQSMVWQWLHGLRPVSWKKAIRIEEVTKGARKRTHIRPDIFGAPRKDRRT